MCVKRLKSSCISSGIMEKLGWNNLFYSYSKLKISHFCENMLGSKCFSLSLGKNGGSAGTFREIFHVNQMKN